MSLEITTSFAEPFFQGVGTSSEVPGKWDVALNGRTYMLDRKHAAFQQGMRTIDLLRQQADDSDRPSEASINPESFWRRAGESWHKGAGQTYFDRPDSDPARFRSSKGINVWEPWQATLLNDTESKRASVSTNTRWLAVNSTYSYIAEGNAVYFTSDITASAPTFTSADIQAGEAAQSVKAITTDGYTVFAALGSNGIHTTTIGATSSTHYSALSCTLVGYVKGRLMAANGNAIYNVTASGAAPSALLTHPNTDFAWVGFAEGVGHIYAAGYSGDKSLVYSTAVKADGTALSTPVVAAQLPDGEIIRSIYGYLGFIIIGTERGFRLATEDDNGFLTLGPLVDLSQGVYCFEGQGQYVWFGWTNYDSTSTGLGRMDLSVFTDTNVPAYASDLMATTQSRVTSIITAGNKRYFSVYGVGFYGETTNKVATGTLDTGLITYGLPDTKLGMYLDVRHQELRGQVAAYVAINGGDMERVGLNLTQGTTAPDSFPVGQLPGESFEIRIELARDDSPTTAGPTFERYTFKAYPSPARGMVILVPILLHERVTVGGAEEEVKVLTEYVELQEFVDSARLVTYQELGVSKSVIVEDMQYERHNPTSNREWWNGTAVLKLKALES